MSDDIAKAHKRMVTVIVIYAVSVAIIAGAVLAVLFHFIAKAW